MQLISKSEFRLENYWDYKQLTLMSIFLYSLIFICIIFLLNGCAQKPKTIIKHEYIEKPVPKLQTISINDLNLSKNKKIKLHIRIKEK